MVHLISRAPKAVVCPVCHRLRLDGIDEGLPYRVDPAPLNAIGELHALLLGRWSYALRPGHLSHRNRDRIKGDGRRGRPIVFADHQCRPWPPAAEHIDAQHAGRVAEYLGRLTAPEPTTADDDALFLIATDLGGRVIGLTDNNQEPPF